MESKMECNVSQMWSAKMPQGLNLEISHHPMTMRSVVNLIIAMERLKGSHSESVLSTSFTDENLLNIMMENIVEEHIVCERSSSPPDQFSRRGVYTCNITDSQKRNFILVQNSMELHAVMLQGGSSNRKVLLNMSTYVHPSPTIEARPVVLGIKDTDFFLSCQKNGAEPTLHLERVENKCDLEAFSRDSEMVRFLFYKQDSGVSISTLMSARFPNWYISTSEQDNRPVMVCQKNARCYQTFNIQHQS
uniref:Interleukin-1 n=1 Tax=Paralichthys olivaceus TaxID=8255 RepID=K7ZQ85_PAROL|nr:interleukin 1 beta [Paralichthys olivaceus]